MACAVRLAGASTRGQRGERGRPRCSVARGLGVWLCAMTGRTTDSSSPRQGVATKCDGMGFGVMERKQFSFFSPATTSSHTVAILGTGQGGVRRWLGARRDAGRSLPSMRVMQRRGSPGKGRVGPDCRAGRHGRQPQDGARAAATVSWLAVAATSWHEGRGSLGRRGWRKGRGGGETHLQEPWPGATRRKDWNRHGRGQGKGIAVEIEGGVEEIMHGARL